MRSERQKDLLRILKAGTASSQLDIVTALRARGHDVTQATVSRDLQEVGAARVHARGKAVYKLADEVSHSDEGDLMARALERTLADFALDIRAAASIVVIKTAPGHASAVARAIDLAEAPGVAGTVAGDDTIFVAAYSAADAKRVASAWAYK